MSLHSRTIRAPRRRNHFAGYTVVGELDSCMPYHAFLPPRLRVRVIRVIPELNDRQPRRLDFFWTVMSYDGGLIFAYRPPGGMSFDELKAAVDPLRPFTPAIGFAPLPWFDDPASVELHLELLRKAGQERPTG